MELALIAHDKATLRRYKKRTLIAIAISFAVLGVVHSAFPELFIVSFVERFLGFVIIVLSYMWCWYDSIINDYPLFKKNLLLVALFIILLPLALIIYMYRSRGFKKGNLALIKAIAFGTFLVLLSAVTGFITCLILGIPI